MNVIYIDTKTTSMEFVAALVNSLPPEIKHQTMVLPKDCEFKENLSFEAISNLKKSIDSLYYLGLSKEGK